LEKLENELSDLKSATSDPNIWNDNIKARDLLKRQSFVQNLLASFYSLETNFRDTIEIINLAESDNDETLLKEAEQNLVKIATEAKSLEIECLFSGEADENNCFLEIHAGAGGTESHDWALMLLRMYLRFSERHNFKSEIVDQLDGEEAGIKSAVIKIDGKNAYGWLKTESGVHRLVRISPFNAAGKRQTSFASVWVYPIIDDSIKVEINEKDLRIDTYRASGAGGQHINKTDSAVRITHLPTNIVVQCQSSRSQHRNRADAFAMLRSKLYELELKAREDKIKAQNAKKTDNSWGNQIRSYVLQPYQMVKDHRSDYETSATSDILDGELDEMISNSLAHLSQY
jgi:peptide chain release factor 2